MGLRPLIVCDLDDVLCNTRKRAIERALKAIREYDIQEWNKAIHISQLEFWYTNNYLIPEYLNRHFKLQARHVENLIRGVFWEKGFYSGMDELQDNTAGLTILYKRMFPIIICSEPPTPTGSPRTSLGDLIKEKAAWTLAALPWLDPAQFSILKDKTIIKAPIKIDDRLRNLLGAELGFLVGPSRDYPVTGNVICVDNLLEVARYLA